MDTRALRGTSVNVSTVGIGCNAFGARVDAEGVHAIVDAAFDHGVNFFDTSDSYSLGESERLLGRAIAGRRENLVIATKFGMDMQGVNGDDGGRRGSAAYVRTAVEASLSRLGTDYIDLYQFHTPDPNTPIDETLEALTELVREGKVRHIGSSNLRAWEVVDAHYRSTIAGFERYVTAQNEYSLYNRAAEEDLVPACEHVEVGILPYFPLAYGLLTGKYKRGEQPPSGSRLETQSSRLESADFDRVEALEEFAAVRGRSMLEVAIGGLAAQPAVTSVIAGVSKAEQVAANAAAVGWKPDADELAALNEAAPSLRRTPSYTTYSHRG